MFSRYKRFSATFHIRCLSEWLFDSVYAMLLCRMLAFDLMSFNSRYFNGTSHRRKKRVFVSRTFSFVKTRKKKKKKRGEGMWRVFSQHLTKHIHIPNGPTKACMIASFWSIDYSSVRKKRLTIPSLISEMKSAHSACDLFIYMNRFHVQTVCIKFPDQSVKYCMVSMNDVCTQMLNHKSPTPKWASSHMAATRVKLAIYTHTHTYTCACAN